MKNAYYRRIPAFFNPETAEIKGRNWFYDILIEINIYIDFKILGIDYLPILVEEE